VCLFTSVSRPLTSCLSSLWHFIASIMKSTFTSTINERITVQFARISLKYTKYLYNLYKPEGRSYFTTYVCSSLNTGEQFAVEVDCEAVSSRGGCKLYLSSLQIMSNTRNKINFYNKVSSRRGVRCLPTSFPRIHKFPANLYYAGIFVYFHLIGRCSKSRGMKRYVVQRAADRG
jgi:hypothetical protein